MHEQNPTREPSAVLIAGPTASGKSAFALALAERVGGVVINADSMQVYRELRILTARPSPEDEARAPHALYGFVPGREAYSTGRYVEDARRAINGAREQGRLAILVGGTGLYFKAVLEGLSPVPAIPPGVRDHWRAEAGRLGAPALHELLARRDPTGAVRLRPSDTQRIVRALEVLDATGRSLADWQRQPGTPVLADAETVKLVLARDRAELHARAEARVDAMLAAGAVEEVRALAELGLAPDLPIIRATGVAPLLAHVAGHVTLSEAVSAVKQETRNYIKRQLTWLRGHMIAWDWLTEQQLQSHAAAGFPFIHH